MKILLLLIGIFGFSISKAQNSIGPVYTSLSKVVQNRWTTGGIEVGTTGDLYSFTRGVDGRTALVSQGDTFYIVNNAESASLVSPWSPEISVGQLAAQGTGILAVQGQGTLGGWRTTSALTAASFYQLTDGLTGLVSNGGISTLANIGSGIPSFDYTSAVSVQGATDHSGSVFTIAHFQPGQMGVADLAAVAAFKTGSGGANLGCDDCFTVTSVQGANGDPVIHFGPSSTNQQFDANSIMADNPVDRRTWLQAAQGNSTVTITSLSLYTGTSQNPGSTDGAINIRLPSGQFFGMATDSSGGTIGWRNYPGGSITFQGGTIYTGANIVDSGFISARSITISDLVGTSSTPPLGVQEYLVSGNSLGNGILIQNTSESPIANTTFTLTQGPYSNTIMTISAYSSSPDRPAGSLWIESGGPNGMVLDATEGGAITFCIDDEPVARMDAKRGLVLLKGHIGLQRVSTAEMMAMADLQPGDQVFNTDRQTTCTYTTEGWKYEKLYRFHY
jgi:hypothetical protein